tara:strand:- start:137 stop:256 length:120 start_codon:yes stop_codon:yes gene_type:complete
VASKKSDTSKLMVARLALQSKTKDEKILGINFELDKLNL